MTEKLDLRSLIGGITDALSALATAALPVIERLMGGLSSTGNIGEKAGSMVLGGAEMIATGLAYAIEYSHLLVAGFRALQSGAAYAIGGLLKAVDFLGSGIVQLLNLLPGVELQWGETIGAMADGVLEEAGRLGTKSGEAFSNFNNSNATNRVSHFFDGVRSNAAQAKAATEQVGEAATATAMKIEQAAATQNAKVSDTLEKLRQQITAFAQTDSEKLAASLTDLGATSEQIAEATGIQAQLDAMEEQKKAQDDLRSSANPASHPRSKLMGNGRPSTTSPPV